MNAPLDASQRAALERALTEVTLDDKYTLERGRAYMSGTQALVRLPMLQRERDRRQGLNTAGFISGYRGSPLGGVDQALWKASASLKRHGIVFKPGLNEDLAATAVWGTQQLALSPGARVDGVFSLWYGKGPGVDRSGDVFKHANAAGTARHGGVLVLAGDDHGAKSSTLPHQSDHVFKACGLPVFYPSSVQEYLDLGLHGWAMSRWSGLWVAMKTVTEVVEASSSVDIDPDRVSIVLPEDFPYPHHDPHGLNLRWPDTPLEQEARLFNYKWYAALAYVRANRLNRTVIDSSRAWFGLLTAGKAYLDTLQALNDLGLDAEACERIGIRVFKCGVVWPLEAATVREFATGLDEILVVEEKRQVLEYALKEELYNWRDDVRPRVYGKFDEKDGRGGEWAMPQGQWLLPALGELSPTIIARAIAARLLNPGQYAPKLGSGRAGEGTGLPPDLRARIEARLAILDATDRALARPHPSVVRTPTFCSGCPHNTSTRVPEGSRAVAGIGCHYMVTWMPGRRTSTFTQMGGEGVPWIGQAPFTDEKHLFANLGDGTYFHSGILALRASIAAGVNITYKLLYNDAVAMTGGQPHDGTLTVPAIVAQVRAEGARKVVVVTDDPSRYQGLAEQPPFDGVEIHPREALDTVQRALREVPGCTVLVYDQTCASEKRRRRKKIVDGRPAYPDPARRVVINEAVCEGCGDCSEQSACVSVEPLETDLGRKRQIAQSSCNKDFSCLKGFCPSFVTVEGGRLRSGQAKAGESGAGEPPALMDVATLPPPAQFARGEGPAYGILVTGIGGSGVVTIGQLLGMAAHLEGKGVSVLDMAGLAQKGGAVTSHVQIADRPDQLFSTRIATGEAELVIGCDLVVTAGADALAKMRTGLTRVLINQTLVPTSDFLRNPDWSPDVEALERAVREAAGPGAIETLDAQTLAVALLGDAIYTNPLMLGFAWQRGWLPLSSEALERAIELNGVAVPANLAAFRWGRQIAHAPETVASLLKPARHAKVIALKRPQKEGDAAAELEALIARRSALLKAWGTEADARRYQKWMDRVVAREREQIGASCGLRLSRTVAHSLARLMAYKDEYEVARLHSDPAFLASLRERFEGDWSLQFHLAPPLLSRLDPHSGRPAKRAFGPWMLPVMRGLARLKFLRGTPLDPFGWTEERRMERSLVSEYEALLDTLLARLDPDRHEEAIALAGLPDQIRGFGPVKAANLARVRQTWAERLEVYEGDVRALARPPIPLKAV